MNAATSLQRPVQPNFPEGRETVNIFKAAMFCTAGLNVIAMILSFAIPACRKNHLPAKMVCSALFITAAVFAALAYGSFTAYSALKIAALSFAFAGDFFLDWKDGKTFYTGVVCFSVCHIIYIATFLFNRTPSLAGYAKQVLVGLLVLGVVSAIHIAINKIKFIGKDKALIPYCLILVTSFIVAVTRGAAALAEGNTGYGICLAAAGTLFLISDGCLAALMFGKPVLPHPDQIVAYTYFPAQTLFAISILYQ